MANEDTFARLKAELERGISSSLVYLDEDGNNVVYIAQNKKYRLNDTEELVRALAYVSLILDYGYSPQQIDIEFTVPYRVPNIHADIVVFKDKAKKSPYIVVECKRELASQGELDQAVEQGFGYANSLKADFLWMTSGIRSDYFKVSGFGGAERVENRVADLPKEGKAEASRAKYTKGGKDGFPIVESYEIVGRPKAKDVLGEAAYRRLYQRSSATLRTLTDDERRLIADLELHQIATASSWIGIEDEFRLAEASEINPEVERAIGRDLAALEGMEAERLAKVKRRAAWIADRFIRERQRAGTITCDDCAFDPRGLAAALGVKPRGFLDVHHNNPLDEGIRYTTTADFALLCPTCHRVEHVRLRKSKRQVAS